jgi:hypothetical protein
LLRKIRMGLSRSSSRIRRAAKKVRSFRSIRERRKTCANGNDLSARREGNGIDTGYEQAYDDAVSGIGRSYEHDRLTFDDAYPLRILPQLHRAGHKALARRRSGPADDARFNDQLATRLENDRSRAPA